MTNLLSLIATFVVLSNVCVAQGKPLSGIWTAGGFEALKKVPPSAFMDEFKKAVTDRTTEVVMCLAFVSGVEQGWKEGHELGVVAAQFPGAWPQDEKKALATLPLKQLQVGQAAMATDVPCIHADLR